MRTYLLFAFAAIVFSTPAFAETVMQAQGKLPIARDGEVIDSVGSGAIDPVLPIVEEEDGISYITGGVGDEELAYLKEQESSFNTRLLIRAKNGEYMSEVDVRFFDSKNAEVLHVENSGPYLYANLPLGVYSVELKSMDGVLKKTKIRVLAKPRDKTYITF